jgi:hypothetical protein
MKNYIQDKKTHEAVMEQLYENKMKIEKLKLLKEKYKIAMQIKDYDRAKKFLLKIKKFEEEE